MCSGNIYIYIIYMADQFRLSDGIYSVRGLIKDVNEEFVLNNFDIVQLQKHEVMESGGKS